MPYPFTPPPFLQGQSVEDIHRRMMATLPDNIDKSEMQIPWDFTRPAAIEKAEFVEFELNEAIKIMFVHWAYGEWLDLHAEAEGLTRRAANRASGMLTVTGKKGTEIAAGFRFATAANLSPSIIFEATESATMDGDPDTNGQVTCSVTVQAIEGGRIGNVPPDTVILMVKPDSGITYVTNPEAITGGAPEESDDELCERVLSAIRHGVSFTGCDADYIRWAKEVPGVGNVVVDPEWDDPNLPEPFHWTDASGQRRCAGTVRLFVVDVNGLPANQQILDAVTTHILQPDKRRKRLAPIEAAVTVTAPQPLVIDITATVTLREGELLEAVVERFREGLGQYWLRAATEADSADSEAALKYAKYVYIGSALAETEGVANYDHESLLVNDGTADIPIALGEFPVTGEVRLIEQARS